jgi:hypothetical protein
MTSPSSFVNGPISGFWQKIEHRPRRPAEFGALRRHDDRPIDEDGMRDHRVEQIIIAKTWIIQPKLGVGRALLPKKIARTNSHRLDQPGERFARWRVFKILDDLRCLAGLADHRQRVEVPQAGL